MAVVETEKHGQVFVVRMNRPDRLNALNHEMRTELSAAWNEFRASNELEVARPAVRRAHRLRTPLSQPRY